MGFVGAGDFVLGRRQGETSHCVSIFPRVVYIHNDQRVMGIILRYVCWGGHRQPPRQLTTKVRVNETVEHPSGPNPGREQPP